MFLLVAQIQLEGWLAQSSLVERLNFGILGPGVPGFGALSQIGFHAAIYYFQVEAKRPTA